MRLAPEWPLLPENSVGGSLVGRVWVPEVGPCVVSVRDGLVIDITRTFPLVSWLLASEDPAARLRAASGPVLGSVEDVLAASLQAEADPARMHLLAPCDLQALKASGVTFLASLMERVIEEAAGGDPLEAGRIRDRMVKALGSALATVEPGSPGAERLKALLQADGLWSQYLEVGIGPDAEIFTKSQPLSAVGTGACVGVHPASDWNNPEPEVVLAISPAGRIVGAALGNDVNLRDVEGRSALLLGRAKDNNASCAIGPFIRLFDGDFGLEALRTTSIHMHIAGADDDFQLLESGDLATISRPLEALAEQTIGPHHHYPDGLMLFLGTMFTPMRDRDVPGRGFTHKPGDIVRIWSPVLGRLENRIGRTDLVRPWTFGAGALMRNLADRGLLSSS